jgi:hypothetical protein
VSQEASIIINGRTLTEAQSMALRVAIGDMVWRMSDLDALGTDTNGRAMTQAYLARAREIERLILTRGVP